MKNKFLSQSTLEFLKRIIMKWLAQCNNSNILEGLGCLLSKCCHINTFLDYSLNIYPNLKVVRGPEQPWLLDRHPLWPPCRGGSEMKGNILTHILDSS